MYDYQNYAIELDDEAKEAMIQESSSDRMLLDRYTPCPDCVGTDAQ